ncbi:MAG: dTMP kinase [Candidatus Ancillula sp.]|jgi:dTMP kinase|nr:dTMP kinase [Candidatus Ancillula sp.]
MFITFEGIDGGGKTTQINLLVKYLKERLPKKEIIVTKEPGGTELGKRLRKEILHGDDIDSKTELFLYLADRAEHVEKIIKPALDRDAIVISDRFFDSTTAYQSAGRGFDLEQIHQLNLFATGNLTPTITFLFDLTVEESQKRIRQNRSDSDRLEQSGIDFFERVREKFLELAKLEPNRFCKIDATAKIENIQKIIIDKVEQNISYSIDNL